MSVYDIKNLAKWILEPFPGVKRACNRAYQLAGYALSEKKIKSEGGFIRMTPEDEYEYFFGYYDKCPWDADDRRMIALRVRCSWQSPAPREPGELVLIDTAYGNRMRIIATTHAWNVQQGCMAQWLGPDFNRYILYNDFRDGSFCSVLFDTQTMREERTLPMPVYDVARDGSFALSLDFSRLHRLRPGYGYSNLPDALQGEPCPDAPCIWRMNLADGRVTPLLKYTDFAAFEPDESMAGAEHKVNHLMLCPDGSRFMVLHRWFWKGRKRTRLVTVNSDGSGLYNLSDDGFVSHCCWKNNREILSFLRKNGTGDHYYLMTDRSREYRMLWPELGSDGHCTYSPDGSLVVTDTYPNRKRLASVFVCSESENHSRRVGRVFSPLRYREDCRCDLHPRWNRRGDMICIDSVHEGKRALYVLPVSDAFAPIAAEPAVKALMVNTVPTIYDGITMVMLNYASNMDRSDMRLDFVAINDVEPSLRQTIGDLDSRLYTIQGRNRHPLRYIRRLSGLVRRNGYQIVHVHGNSSTMAVEMLAAWLGGARVRCAHSHNTKSHHPWFHRLLRPAFNAFYTHGFACGQAAGRWMYGKRPFTVLNNGIDAEKYAFDAGTREAYRERLGLRDRIAIGHVAHFTYHKNHGFLVDAFEKLYAQDGRYRLVLVGSGKYRQEIEEKVRQKGLGEGVLFVGTSREIPQILSAMDFMVLPSLFEGLPNVLIEWQASGLPALVADTITREAKLTDLISFLPLEQASWTEAMRNIDYAIDRAGASRDAVRTIGEAGYDIRRSAARLKALYLQYLGAARTKDGV